MTRLLQIALPNGVIGTTAPRSTNRTRPIRYNITNNKFEGYENGAWRNLRYAEPFRRYLQQSLGNGDATAVCFDLAPRLPHQVAAQHVIVLVENVFASNNKLYYGTESFATGTVLVNAGSQISNQYKIVTVGTTDFTAIGASANTVDTDPSYRSWYR